MRIAVIGTGAVGGYFGAKLALAGHDVTDLAAGRRLELPWLSGAVVRLGRRHGVPTPIHDTIHAALEPYAGGTTD